MSKRCEVKFLLMSCLMVLLSTVVSTGEVLAQQAVVNKLFSLDKQQPKAKKTLLINPDIIALKTLSEHDKAAAQLQLPRWKDLTLNQAEHYLLHVIRGNISNVAGQENTVINWLNKAIALEPFIVKKQLDSPIFADVYLTLASIYKNQGEDKKAFDSKQKYIERYFAYLKQQKMQSVNFLNDKYDIEKNQEENELLAQNSKIKHYALMRAESEREQQMRHIMIFIATGFVFTLLLIRQYKIHQALNSLAKTDSLTLLANRGSLFENGAIYLEQALTKNNELSVLMLDIDDWKTVYDNFGHQAGDNTICNIAELASETMRSRDFLARIGGTEFAAILPDATIEQARAIAEHLREKIEDNITSNDHDNFQVTVSIGLASIRDVSDSFDSLLHAADMAMYQAKAQGSNQVCCYDIEKNNK